LEIELRDKGAIIQTARLVAYAARRPGETATGADGSVLLKGLSNALPGKALDTDSCELRVRGDPTEAASIWDADRWWSGSFSMPLAEALRKPEDR
jgi:hypothetical protein